MMSSFQRQSADNSIAFLQNYSDISRDFTQNKIIMLIELTIKNFKSFRDETAFSLVAAGYDRETREYENVVDIPKYDLRVLRSAIVYGGNASGKSKFFNAFEFMQDLVLRSVEMSWLPNALENLHFSLDTVSGSTPVEFEAIFLHKDKLFRYGFALLNGKVERESLNIRVHKKEMPIFTREGDNYTSHRSYFKQGKLVISRNLVRENALCLTVAAMYNDEIASEAVEWFRNVISFSGVNLENPMNLTMAMLNDPVKKKKILTLLSASDLGIEDVVISRTGFTGQKDLVAEEIQRYAPSHGDLFLDLRTVHRRFSPEGKSESTANFSMDSDESAGTRKFFALAGPILTALEKGLPVVVDELDAGLHPKLVHRLVELFNSAESNPHNAQLIFNSQTTHLLSADLFRRDQVWFVEKDTYGVSKLFSLIEIKVRKTDKFEKYYLDGRYGGIPFLGEFEFIKFDAHKERIN